MEVESSRVGGRLQAHQCDSTEDYFYLQGGIKTLLDFYLQGGGTDFGFVAFSFSLPGC